MGDASMTTLTDWGGGLRRGQPMTIINIGNI